jgi:flagellar motor switch protein FliN/FliY
MTPEDALIRIGESTAAAVVAALSMFSPDGIEAGAPVVIGRESDPVADLSLPAVMAEVSYVDGVTGGNLFCMPLAGARTLAAAMMGEEPDPGADAGALTELELSAVGEATNQMMAAAAAATATVLGEEVGIDAPRVRVAAVAADALGALDASASVVSVPVEVLGHPCRLIQMVPHAFVVRMTRALDDLASEYVPADLAAATQDGPLPADALGDIKVRVWAELGRAQMPIRRAVSLAPGAVIDLDRALEEPIDLYVNGRRFATGRLVTVDETEWAVQIDTVAPGAALPIPTQGDS